MIILESGINHFGELKEANKIMSFFLDSDFTHITFMIHNNKFYLNEIKQNGINFKLDQNVYKRYVNECHRKNKKIGISVCDLETFNEVKNLKFDFYKILSISINNFELINELKKKDKPIYISTGFGASNIKIKKCLEAFKKKTKQLSILHTPMTYDSSKINFQRINILRKIFRLPVGYSNHNNDPNNLNILSAYNPDVIFVYCKPTRKKNRIYPDHDHAFFLDELNDARLKYNKYLSMHKYLKKIEKIEIFKNGYKI
jgi:sialic acid synthase SpsE